MKLTENDIGKYYLVRSKYDSRFYSRQFLHRVLDNGDMIFKYSNSGHQYLISDPDMVLREVDKDTHRNWRMVDKELIKI